jgi:hypothetical protein
VTPILENDFIDLLLIEKQYRVMPETITLIASLRCSDRQGSSGQLLSQISARGD